MADDDIPVDPTGGPSTAGGEAGGSGGTMETAPVSSSVASLVPDPKPVRSPQKSPVAVMLGPLADFAGDPENASPALRREAARKLDEIADGAIALANYRISKGANPETAGRYAADDLIEALALDKLFPQLAPDADQRQESSTRLDGGDPIGNDSFQVGDAHSSETVSASRSELGESVTTPQSVEPAKPDINGDPGQSEDARCLELQTEMITISRKQINTLRNKRIPEARKSLNKAERRLENLRKNAPKSIPLPTWVKFAKKMTPSGFGMEIGKIIGKVIVKQDDNDRLITHQEQIVLWENYIETLERGIVDLRAEERELFAQIEDKERERKTLGCE